MHAVASQTSQYDFDFRLEIDPVFTVKSVSAFGDTVAVGNRGYRSARITRCGGTEIYSTPLYRSNHWPKVDHI